MALDSTQLVAPDIGALNASYDGKMLTLVASGRVDGSICGITFIRLPVKSPELAFELRGWNSGVLPTSTKKHFHCTESLPIDLGGVYKGTVIIFDYNNPDGEEIRIEKEGTEDEELSPEGETSSKKSVQISTLLKDEYPKFSWAAPILIRLDKRDPIVFETSCLASDPPALPTTSIAYDRTFFELRRALGHSSKLEWFLTARQTGQTTVLTNTYDDNTDTIKVSRYIVTIRNDPKESCDPVTIPDHCFSLQIPPCTWLDFVDFGYSLIKIEWPTSQIVEVRTTPIAKSERPQHALDLCKIQLICHVPKVENGSPARTTLIHSTGRMTWGRVGCISSTWSGSEVIPWRHPIKLGLLESYDILSQSKLAHCGSGIETCTLRHPSGPGVKQPYYIYTFGDFRIVGVGVNDKSIRSFGMGNFSLLPMEYTDPFSSTLPVNAGIAHERQDGRQIRIAEHLKRGCVQPRSKEDSPESWDIACPEADSPPAEKKDAGNKSSYKPRITRSRVAKPALKGQRKKQYAWMGTE